MHYLIKPLMGIALCTLLTACGDDKPTGKGEQ